MREAKVRRPVACRTIIAGVAMLLIAASTAGGAAADGASAPGHRGPATATLRGVVESGGAGLEGYEVSLYASSVGPFGRAGVLGRAITGAFGEFEIDYRLTGGKHSRLQPILLVRAERGNAMLASAIGHAPVSGPVVVNERTTVATGFAFAQFVEGLTIEGNRYGMVNAVHMAANLAYPETGTVAAVLRLPPNGPETSALRTFNSLANVVAFASRPTPAARPCSMRPRCQASRARPACSRQWRTSPDTRG